MSIWWALALGILQGLTEFLPVSSSGHLVLAQSFLPAFAEVALPFDVVLHLGTLAAVMAFFRADLRKLLAALFPGGGSRYRRLILWIVAASVPTGLLGLGFQDQVEHLFTGSRLVGAALLFTALLLFLSDRVKNGSREAPATGWWRSLLVGLAQGVAIVPGISRSGATITMGIFLGLERSQAARFSFLISIPAILGATLLNLREIGQLGAGAAAPLLAGFLAALVSGYLALGLLMRVVRSKRLSFFAWYCLVLGIWGLWA